MSKQRQGLLITGDAPVQFTFEGQRFSGLPGDTLASALLANGQWLQSRSFKYHRPRGPLSLSGQDANTLVQLGPEPNVLADRTPLSEGLSASGQNYVGSLAKDGDSRLGFFGRFMPVGFYYRAFYKPRGIWDRWEKVIRKKAGLGVLDTQREAGYHDKQYLFCDIAVVGAGPAGLAAALRAADAGASVLLIEQDPYIGGSLAWHRYDVQGGAAAAMLADLRRVEAHPRIRTLTDATCNAWFADHYLPVIQGTRLYKVRAKQTVLASGALEQHVVFHNNDLPGIVLCSAAERMLALYGITPGNKALVLAGNDQSCRSALTLADAGVQVSAVVDMRASPDDPALLQALSERAIRYIPGHTVYSARGSGSQGRISQAEIRPITAPGEVGNTAETIDCDLLCMSSGYMPAWQLPCQAGAKLSYQDEVAGFRLSGQAAGVHLAGSVNNIFTAEAVVKDGERAAAAALAALGYDVDVPESVSCALRPNYDWPMFAHPKGKEFVDFDEDLQLRDIVNATRMGYRDIQLVKRFSTVGMGPSQGRHSALPTARLVAKATGRTISETGVTTARPPFAPEKVAHNAGRVLHPYRQTPMHHRHLEAGAHMVPVGDWQRPAYYGQPDQARHCIESEAMHVRNAVGLIDVGTLGKIELRGPDAAELLNRLYTASFDNMEIGSTRYAIMTNEHGVVIDDGVACRLGETHFYITATTSGVTRVYRAMTQWNAQWRLDVDILNVTGAFAAVNLAGPLSHKVLAAAGTDVDISAAGFPYLAYREGQVAGISARLMRVGFVGELGYEIHVPARYGEALWDALIKAGRAFGIKPFGVDTQRLLRLEKGHLIVGQDTDGMSHPGELNLNWAVDRKKPFFVGQRSVAIMKREQTQRHLVAFELPAGSETPAEGLLVLEGAEVSGKITSCAYSPTLDKVIGLAWASSAHKKPGSQIVIKSAGGEPLTATVVKLPFYDKALSRQEIQA
ncbi:2Fe-2S iron-sulfur cluster-binding protein [Granulosicoccaceae sp. 1_MG-2023]|nr:2Fe-2S iron-sulfur cluster-binding protein [Granulosicoccaceae sp. 1_MG-2023]